MRFYLKKVMLTIVLIANVLLIFSQTAGEKAFVTTALSFADGNWPEKDETAKLDKLEPAAAVKYVAKKAGVISQSQSNALTDEKVISINDQRATDLRTVPYGFIIGFVNTMGGKKVSHVMIALGKGVALGTDNYKNIGMGTNDKWEMINLSTLHYDLDGGLATMKGNFFIVCKSVDQILNTNASRLPPAQMDQAAASKNNDYTSPSAAVKNSGTYTATPSAVKSNDPVNNTAASATKPRNDPAEYRRISDSLNKAEREKRKSVTNGNLPLPGMAPAIPAEPTGHTVTAPAEPADNGNEQTNRRTATNTGRSANNRPAVPAEPANHAVTAPAEPGDNGNEQTNRRTATNTGRSANSRPAVPAEPAGNAVAPPAEPQDTRSAPATNRSTTRTVPPPPANEKPVAPAEPPLPGKQHPPGGEYSSAGIVFNPMMDIDRKKIYTVKDWSNYGDPANPNPALNQFALFKQKKPANSKIVNVVEYVTVAYNFYNNHPVAQEIQLDNGDLVLYDAAINLLAVYDKEGKPKEMFCPDSKEELFTKYKVKAGKQ